MQAPAAAAAPAAPAPTAASVAPDGFGVESEPGSGFPALLAPTWAGEDIVVDDHAPVVGGAGEGGAADNTTASPGDSAAHQFGESARGGEDSTASPAAPARTGPALSDRSPGTLASAPTK